MTQQLKRTKPYWDGSGPKEQELDNEKRLENGEWLLGTVGRYHIKHSRVGTDNFHCHSFIYDGEDTAEYVMNFDGDGEGASQEQFRPIDMPANEEAETETAAATATTANTNNTAKRAKRQGKTKPPPRKENVPRLRRRKTSSRAASTRRGGKK